jgi:hypothetical protein
VSAGNSESHGRRPLVSAFLPRRLMRKRPKRTRKRPPHELHTPLRPGHSPKTRGEIPGNCLQRREPPRLFHLRGSVYPGDIPRQIRSLGAREPRSGPAAGKGKQEAERNRIHDGGPVISSPRAQLERAYINRQVRHPAFRPHNDMVVLCCGCRRERIGGPLTGRWLWVHHDWESKRLDPGKSKITTTICLSCEARQERINKALKTQRQWLSEKKGTAHVKQGV